MPKIRVRTNQSAVNALSRKVDKMSRKQSLYKPEEKWYCNAITETVNAAKLVTPTEDMYIAGVVDGVKCRLTRWKCQLHIQTPANLSTDNISFRVIIARSKVGALTAGDFPSTITSCVDHDDKVVYHDKVYNSNSHNLLVGGTMYAGFNQITIGKSRKYKSGLQLIRDDSLEDKNPLYVYLCANNYASGATVNGTFEMYYFDA